MSWVVQNTWKTSRERERDDIPMESDSLHVKLIFHKIHSLHTHWTFSQTTQWNISHIIRVNSRVCLQKYLKWTLLLFFSKNQEWPVGRGAENWTHSTNFLAKTSVRERKRGCWWEFKIKNAIALEFEKHPGKVMLGIFMKILRIQFLKAASEKHWKWMRLNFKHSNGGIPASFSLSAKNSCCPFDKSLEGARNSKRNSEITEHTDIADFHHNLSCLRYVFCLWKFSASWWLLIIYSQFHTDSRLSRLCSLAHESFNLHD